MQDAAADREDFVFSPEQRRLEHAINSRVDQALAVYQAENEREADAARVRALEHASMVAGMGPAGCGKTVVLDRCIRRAVEKGARVMFALPTGQLASRMRLRYRDFQDIDVDTCHGAFLLHKPLQETLTLLLDYDLVVIDEVPQLLDWHFDRLHELWLAAERLPCVVMTGDEWQLPPPDRQHASLTEHPKFRQLVHRVDLHKIWRQAGEDPLTHKLAVLRKFDVTSREAEDFVADLCREHKAWSDHNEPTGQELDDLFRRTDYKTTLVTCSRQGAALLNELSVEVLFHNRNKRALTTLPGDFEDNPENYDAGGQLRSDEAPRPKDVAIYKGLRIVLTKNLNKANHFVNGMSAEVQSYDEHTRGLVVKTATGNVLSVFPWTDAEAPVRPVTYYPLRVGYASTIYKYQGANLPHVTIWLDRPNCKAAAYVALSRVRRDKDYLFGGIVTPAHLTPAK